jgi:hypothetical protein
LAVSIAEGQGTADKPDHVLTWILSAVFFLISVTFVWRSFYAMRIKKQGS